MFNNYRFERQFSSYYNPYYGRPRISWNNLLNNTQKTLGIINQIIPIWYQIGPIYRNFKTMFKVASEINKSDDINTNTYSDNRKEDSNNITNNYDNNGPNFFV